MLDARVKSKSDINTVYECQWMFNFKRPSEQLAPPG